MAGFLKTLPSGYGPDLTFWTIQGYYLDALQHSLRIDLAGWFDQSDVGVNQSPLTVPILLSGAANPIVQGQGGGSLTMAAIIAAIITFWPDATYVTP